MICHINRIRLAYVVVEEGWRGYFSGVIMHALVRALILANQTNCFADKDQFRHKMNESYGSRQACDG